MPLNALLVQTPVTGRDGRISEPWRVYFRDQDAAVGTTTVTTVPPVQLVDQTASIGTTAIPTPALPAGLYQVNTFAHVTTAAGVSSSLQVTISFTQNGIALTRTGTAQTGNTTATIDINSWVIQIDENTPISYSTTYASNAAAAMKYLLTVSLQTVSRVA